MKELDASQIKNSSTFLSRVNISHSSMFLVGFVLGGQITTTDANGVQETVDANDLFYWPAGHKVKVNLDAEIIMFSPQNEHSHVINHMIEKVKG